MSVRGAIESFARQMTYSVVRDEYTATQFDTYKALALAVRDQIVERWFPTQEHYYKTDAKRVYYLSLEFLLGRLLQNNIMNLARLRHLPAGDRGSRLRHRFARRRRSRRGPGQRRPRPARRLLPRLRRDPRHPLLRLRHPLRVRHLPPAVRRRVPDRDARQLAPLREPVGDPATRRAVPDPLLRPRRRVRSTGRRATAWVDTQDVWAMAFDIPIVGYGNDTVNTLRLWAAKSSREFDLAKFNAGDYVRAVEHKNETENISKVLYPPDDQYAGKELRLKQQYFFVSATMQDLIRRFRKRRTARPWIRFPGQGGRAAQRHASGDRDPRADADPDRSGGARVGRGVAAHREDVRVHEPHDPRRGARGVADRVLRAPAAAARPDHRGDRPPAAERSPRPLRARTARRSRRRPSSTTARAWCGWPISRSSAPTR